jgi:glycosyltransferase involved in cell wall biosynthesis
VTSRRLFFLIGQLSAGGAERQLAYLLQAIERERYRPAVAVWNYRAQDLYVPRIASLGVPVYSLGTASSSVSRLLVLRHLIEDLRAEVVHSYSFFTNVVAHSAALGTNAVAVGSVRGDYVEDVRSSGLLRGTVNSRWPRLLIFNSVSALRNAQTSRRMSRPRMAVVVRNGLDVMSFRADRTPPIQERPTVLGVGSLVASKRWDRLLTASAQLKRAGGRFKMDIAGDGPMKGRLQRLANDLGVSDCVRFLGHVDPIAHELEGASCLVHPSDSEGCPNVVMEAMACGRAVVATGSGDVPLLVDDGTTGFVLERDDETGLVNSLRTLLENHELCCEMGRAARRKAEREFSLARLVSDTLNAYGRAGWHDATSLRTLARTPGAAQAPRS